MPVSLAPTPVRPSEGNSFRFTFCQRLWDLTKRWDDIAVADMVANMVANMEVIMVAYILRILYPEDLESWNP